LFRAVQAGIAHCIRIAWAKTQNSFGDAVYFLKNPLVEGHFFDQGRTIGGGLMVRDSPRQKFGAWRSKKWHLTYEKWALSY
jgi:hypothetical protein